MTHSTCPPLHLPKTLIPNSSFVLDGWAFTNNVIIKNHRSLEDRKIAAQFLQKNHPLCPVVLDTMENLSSSKYAALPERLYLLQGGKVIYKVKKYQ